MPKIIDIDALLPDDAILHWRGQEWRIPGDLAVEPVLALQKAAAALQAAAESQQESEVFEALTELARQVQGALAIRQPERAVGLTFGARELGILAGTIVSVVGGSQAEARGDTEGNAEAAAQ